MKFCISATSKVQKPKRSELGDNIEKSWRAELDLRFLIDLKDQVFWEMKRHGR